MKLYLIQFDGETYYVEATSMAAALATWHAYADAEGEEPEDPESVACVHDRAVLREARS